MTPACPYTYKLTVTLANPNAPKDSDGDGVPDQPAADTTPAAATPATTAPATAPAMMPSTVARLRPRMPPRRGRSRAVKKKMSIRDLDFSNTGAWPREFKIGFCALLALFIIGFSWWFWVTDKRDELAGLDGQEASCAPNSKPSRAAPPTSSR